MVVDVQPNGNMVVAGKRVIQIDKETKTLRVSGLVRHLDVTAGNTVTSSMVADARISFTSEGRERTNDHPRPRRDVVRHADLGCLAFLSRIHRTQHPL